MYGSVFSLFPVCPCRYQPCLHTWLLRVEPFLSRYLLEATVGLLDPKLNLGTTWSWLRRPATQHLNQPTHADSSDKQRLVVWRKLSSQHSHHEVPWVPKLPGQVCKWLRRSFWRSGTDTDAFGHGNEGQNRLCEALHCETATKGKKLHFFFFFSLPFFLPAQGHYVSDKYCSVHRQ